MFPPAVSLAIMAIGLIILAANTGWSAEPAIPVALVNGTAIYQSDLSCAIEIILAENPTSYKGQQDNEKALGKLIDIELLYQESLKHRFHGLIEESEERYQVEVKRMGSEERLMSTLQCNNMTPEQFRKTIFRNLSIKKLLEKVVYSRIRVTEDEIREYYELHKDRYQKPKSVRFRQIMIKGPSGAEEDKWRQAWERAFAIYKDASTGVDFVRLARRHSEDPASASAGGDMGIIHMGNMQGVVDTMIFSLKAGTVTKPIRSHQGFHIIQIVSIVPPTTKTFDEVKQRVTTIMRRKQAGEMTSQLIADLRLKAKIEIIKSSTQYPVPGTQ